MSETIERPRSRNGRFVRITCTDPNCDGELKPDRDDEWRCNGLTHDTDVGPLYACTRVVSPSLESPQP